MKSPTRDALVTWVILTGLAWGLLRAGPAWAQRDPHAESASRISNKITPSGAGTTVVSVAAKVRRIVFTPSVAGGELALFDASTDTGTAKYEVRSGTANDTKVIDLSDVPLAFDTALTVQVSSGYAYVEYE